MTQATDNLTAEKLAKLAWIAGLRLDCYSDGREYWGWDKSPICAKGAFRPDQNWPHLGRVIDGMAARGKLLGIEVVPPQAANPAGTIQRAYFCDVETGIFNFVSFYWEPETRTWTLPLPLAICRAALAAKEE